MNTLQFNYYLIKYKIYPRNIWKLQENKIFVVRFKLQVFILYIVKLLYTNKILYYSLDLEIHIYFLFSLMNKYYLVHWLLFDYLIQYFIISNIFYFLKKMNHIRK